VEGVEAASYLYFQRPPKRLSLSQSIMLTVVPNRPNSLRPDRHPDAMRKARDKWAMNFAEKGIFSRAEIADALKEPVSSVRTEIPVRAPQFSLRLLAERKDEKIYTFLDPKIQSQTETLLRNHVDRVKHQGIGNGAVIVLDRSSNKVLAYCGSADFMDKAALGEVDAIQAIRSPGSTLKPFLYAHAFDAGLLTPMSKVKDLPFESAGYAPLNYDRTCKGEVSAEYALRHSLNLPAVRLLDEIGLEPFVDGLAQSGFSKLQRHRSDYGLSLILGGCGVTLEELVRAYSGLANGGKVQALKMSTDAPCSPSRQVISSQAAYVTTEILAGLERPDLPQGVLERSSLPKVAWKTGTSFGRRDAWAIGYTPRHVVGVWMGNMDGRAVSSMSGAATATPLLLAIFNSLEAGLEKNWFQMPLGVERKIVCAETGLFPGQDCPHTITDLHIRSRSSASTCSHVRIAYTNDSGTVRYCPRCLPAKGYKTLKYADLEPELLGWMQRTDRSVVLPPPHNPNCAATYHGKGPTIVSPKRSGEYWLESGQSIVLQASVPPTVNQLFWFANNKFIGASAADGKLAYAPTEATLHIACMDDQGQKSEIAVELRYF
jgi:penicillin-binding protein 1C